MRTLFKLTWVEMKLFIRDPLTMAFTLALPVIDLVVLAAFGIIALPVHLTSYRERGILRRFRASSISIRAVLGSQLIVAAVIGIVSSVLLYLIAILIYDIALPKEPGLFLVAFVLGILSMTAFGFLLGSLIPTTRAAQGIGIILFFLMLILGGAGPPPEVLPDAMRIVGNFTPVKHVVVILQNPWLGFGWGTSASLIVGGTLAGSVLISARFFRWE